jgi:hypothetical protein
VNSVDDGTKMVTPDWKTGKKDCLRVDGPVAMGGGPQVPNGGTAEGMIVWILVVQTRGCVRNRF